MPSRADSRRRSHEVLTPSERIKFLYNNTFKKYINTYYRCFKKSPSLQFKYFWHTWSYLKRKSHKRPPKNSCFIFLYMWYSFSYNKFLPRGVFLTPNSQHRYWQHFINEDLALKKTENSVRFLNTWMEIANLVNLLILQFYISKFYAFTNVNNFVNVS